MKIMCREICSDNHELSLNNMYLNIKRPYFQIIKYDAQEKKLNMRKS